jgi:AsmA protein
MKKVLSIGIGVLVILFAVVLLLPPFINLGVYKVRYLPLVEQALERKVDVGEVRLRLIPAPALRISSLNVSDNPSFSKDPFFTAEQARLKLKFWPLLKGQFQVDEFILEKPSINLVKQPNGIFNFSDIGKKKDKTEKKEKKEGPRKTKEPIKLSELIPARLRIEQGNITFQTKGRKPLQIRGFDVSLKDFSTDHPFPYRVALSLPGLKPISLEGPLSYQESGAILTLKENHLKAQDIDFPMNGTVSDLTGVPQLNLTLGNDGFEVKPIVQLLSAAEITPKELEISGPMGLRVAVKGPSNSIASRVDAQLKGLKVSDRRAFNGNVTGEILLSLALGGDAPLTQSLRGNGKLAAKDGVLTNVDLIEKIQQITGLIGVPKEQRSGATTFKTLETEFTLASGIADIQKLFLVSPMMEAQGGGKITLASQSLDLRIEVALSPEISARAGKGKAATFFKDQQGRVVVPLRITGPAKGPSVNPDSEKLIKKGMGQLLEKGKGSFFERLFKKR